jgi:4-hydroxybenzoate polyprenyltransferase
MKIISKVKPIVMAMRIRQWVKNLFIFAGIFFAGKLFHFELLLEICIGFVLFGLAASSIYIFNDIHDLEHDKAHPVKRNRPLAAGLISIHSAYIVAIFSALIALIGAFALDVRFFGIVLAYLVINIAYTMKIKELVILDVMCIASGFVLRVLAGTLLSDASPSEWIIVCTITLSLFLGFSKRRQELALTGSKATNQRRVLDNYSIGFLDQMISVATASTVIAYALYSVSPQTVYRLNTRNLAFTIPFVLYGIYRYLFLMHQKKSGEDPTTEMFTDLPLIINGILWLLTVLVVIY